MKTNRIIRQRLSVILYFHNAAWRIAYVKRDTMSGEIDDSKEFFQNLFMVSVTPKQIGS